MLGVRPIFVALAPALLLWALPAPAQQPVLAPVHGAFPARAQAPAAAFPVAPTALPAPAPLGALPIQAQEPTAASRPVATVKTVSGAAFVVDGAGGARVPAVVGTRLRTGDRLVTGLDGAMGVIFTDNTMLSLGPDSEILVERFAYDPAAKDYGFATRISQGTFLFVSGRIAQSAPQSVAVTTPNGSIDIQGARFLVKVQAP